MMNDFGWAIAELKKGNHVARKGWNGKGMHLVLSEPKSSHFVRMPDALYKKITTDQSYILMFTAAGVYQPGWLASQNDMLAEDWEVV